MIRAVLFKVGIKLHEDTCLIHSLTKACRLINDKVKTRLPIHRGILNVLLKNIPRVFDKQPYLETMYKALFITAYFGLFRVGELTLGTHPVLAKDVHIALNKKKLLFLLRTSKTHGEDVKPQIVKISSREPCSNVKEKCNATVLDFC